jgi:hypothetical protein
MAKDVKKGATKDTPKSNGNTKLNSSKPSKKKTSIGNSRNSRKNNKDAQREKKGK